MTDFILVLAIFLLFGLGVLYVRVCERL